MIDIAKCTVKKTNRNSHIVWQIIAECGTAVPGLPVQHAGMKIMGAMGWKTKREASSMLERMRATTGDRSDE